jgi:hypothetical protein
MLAAQLDLQVADALLRLRAYAFVHDEPLSRLARQVLERRLTLESDDEPGAPR